MKIKIICVNGSPGVGKTSFEQMCSYILGPYYRSRSTVDKVKEIARFAGWDGHKDLAGRRFLSHLKQVLTEYNDIPFKDIQNHAVVFEEELEEYGVNPEKGVMFVDVREPEAIQKIVDELGAKTLLIRRPEVESEETSNSSDADVLNYKYDYTVYNNGTFEELKNTAKEFLNNIGVI